MVVGNASQGQQIQHSGQGNSKSALQDVEPWSRRRLNDRSSKGPCATSCVGCKMVMRWAAVGYTTSWDGIVCSQSNYQSLPVTEALGSFMTMNCTLFSSGLRRTEQGQAAEYFQLSCMARHDLVTQKRVEQSGFRGN